MKVKFNIQFEEEANLLSSTVATNTLDATLWVDYIYLDTDERRRFAQVSHEYLIEQLQHTGTESIKGGTASTYNLNFNHPVKELVWCANVPTSHVITMKGSAGLTGPTLSNLSCNLGRLSNGGFKDAPFRLDSKSITKGRYIVPNISALEAINNVMSAAVDEQKTGFYLFQRIFDRGTDQLPR